MRRYRTALLFVGCALAWVAGLRAQGGAVHTYIGAAKCKSCHGAMGGASFESYAAAMKGGSTGPSILAGKPDDSPLVKLQAKGDHMGNFAPDELEKVKAWIKAGALEK